MIISCQKNNNNDFPLLKMIANYPVVVPGISDLANYNSPDEFLTVSDTLGGVYVISATGELIRKLDYTGSDLEGITYLFEDHAVFILEEKKKEVVKLDTNGNEMLHFPVPVNNAFIKHGPEGIAFNPLNEHLYIVNEKSPPLLIEMTLDGSVVDTNLLNFAKDYSAVYCDAANSSLWILSDESELVAQCDLKGNPVKQYRTGIPKCEGLVVDSPGSRIYIISEQTGMLYVFSY
jgi:uncharacterized protein YjiK